MSDDAPAGPGRRPGSPDTRGAILAAAREEFAAKPFGSATVRAVARRAGVDPALVHHYFGSKQDLFAATLELPVVPSEVMAQIVEAPPDQRGERFARVFFDIWNDPIRGPVALGLVRSGMSDDAVADQVRSVASNVMLPNAVRALHLEGDELTVTLLFGCLMGVMVARRALVVEPLASADIDELIARLAPGLQAILDGRPQPGS